jgi:ADP-L-glycero-D-manno-heptose 6-epimerase
MSTQKNVLITGGTGFIGSNLMKTFLSKTGYNITVLDRTLKEHNMVSNDSVEYIKFDLKNSNHLTNLFKDKDFDYIFHQGAVVDTTYDHDDIYEVNSEPIHMLIELAKKSDAKIVYASSCAVYGNTSIPNRVNYNEEPLNKYAISKLLQDKIVRGYLHNGDERIPIVGLRYSNVYGPGESHKGNMSSMVYQIREKIEAGIPVKLFEYGEQKRDFIYVKDIVEYNLQSAFSGKTGIFNAGFGESFSFNDMMRFFELMYRKKIDVDFIQNPYTFYQNHTLTELDVSLYKPVYDLRRGINDYFGKNM